MPRPRLAHLALAATLLPVVAMSALWGASYWAHRGVNLVWRDDGVGSRTWCVTSADGCAALLLYHVQRTDGERSRRASPSWTRDFFWSITRFPTRPGSWPAPTPQRFWHTLGFRHFLFEQHHPDRSGSARLIAVPYRYLFLLAALLPLRRTIHGIRGWRWARHGRCARCGYDLRASKQRCPECGAAFGPTRSA